MTQLLSSASKRSRFLFDWDARYCLAAPDQSLNAITGQVATFSRAGTKTAVGSAGAIRIVPDSMPAWQWSLDPVSGLMVPGLLAEDTRTNIAPRSQEYDNAVWNKSNITITANAIAAPDGSLTADKIAATATAVTNINQAIVVTGTRVALSFFVKKGTGATTFNNFGIYNQTTAANLYFITFNYDTGAVSLVAGTGTTTVTALANGWWRIEMVHTTAITSGNTIAIYTGGATGQSMTAGDYCYAWGAQLEVGTSCSSYIPTTTAAVARTIDALSAQFKALPQALTFYIKFVESGTILTATTNGLLGIGASSNASLFIYNNGSGLYAVTHRVGSDVSSTVAAAPTIGQGVELRAVLSSTGTVLLGQSIAGATETVGATSAALPLAAAWFDTTLTINDRGGANGYSVIQSVRISAGAQSMAAMRAA